jgi:hypothetical protein
MMARPAWWTVPAAHMFGELRVFFWTGPSSPGQFGKLHEVYFIIQICTQNIFYVLTLFNFVQLTSNSFPFFSSFASPRGNMVRFINVRKKCRLPPYTFIEV